MARSDRPGDAFGEPPAIAKALASLNSGDLVVPHAMIDAMAALNTADLVVPRGMIDAMAKINDANFVMPHGLTDALAAIEAGSITSSIGSYYGSQFSAIVDAQTSLYASSISSSVAAALESSTYKSLIGAENLYSAAFGSQLSGLIGAQNAFLAEQISPITSAIAEATSALNSQHFAGLDAIFAANGRISSMYDEILGGSKLAVQSRLWTLEKAFEATSATEADGFGRLRDAASEIPTLTDAVEGGIRSTQHRGTFGPNLTPLRESAEAVAEIMDNGGEEALKRPLAEVQDLTSLDDELLLDWGEALGWWDHVKTHRVSTAGILLGFTAGLVRFVLGPGSPEAAFDSVATGGAVYLFVSANRPPTRDSNEG